MGFPEVKKNIPEWVLMQKSCFQKSKRTFQNIFVISGF